MQRTSPSVGCSLCVSLKAFAFRAASFEASKGDLSQEVIIRPATVMSTVNWCSQYDAPTNSQPGKLCEASADGLGGDGQTEEVQHAFLSCDSNQRCPARPMEMHTAGSVRLVAKVAGIRADFHERRRESSRLPHLEMLLVRRGSDSIRGCAQRAFGTGQRETEQKEDHARWSPPHDGLLVITIWNAGLGTKA